MTMAMAMTATVGVMIFTKITMPRPMMLTLAMKGHECSKSDSMRLA